MTVLLINRIAGAPISESPAIVISRSVVLIKASRIFPCRVLLDYACFRVLVLMFFYRFDKISAIIWIQYYFIILIIMYNYFGKYSPFFKFKIRYLRDVDSLIKKVI